MIKVIIILSIILILIYLFPLAVVQGTSMLPTLKEHQVIITKRILPKEKLKEGNIYVYKSPQQSELLIIKRLTNLRSNECYFLGDNPAESYDSRDYGYVKAENIIAVLIWNTKYQIKQKGKKNE